MSPAFFCFLLFFCLGDAVPISIGDLSPDLSSVGGGDEERAHYDGTKELEVPINSGSDHLGGTFVITPDEHDVVTTDEHDYGFEEDNTIPPKVYLNILKYKSIDEFMAAGRFNVSIRVFGGPLDGVPSGGCIPKKKCVSVRPEKRATDEEVFPLSVDIERCGGCCGHPDLECLPWSTEPVTVRLVKFGYSKKEDKLEYRGETTTTIIRDLQCKCRRIQT